MTRIRALLAENWPLKVASLVFAPLAFSAIAAAASYGIAYALLAAGSAAGAAIALRSTRRAAARPL